MYVVNLGANMCDKSENRCKYLHCANEKETQQVEATALVQSAQSKNKIRLLFITLAAKSMKAFISPAQDIFHNTIAINGRKRKLNHLPRVGWV